MKVIKVLPQGFASNSYILTQDNKSAVVVDPAEPRIIKVLAENKLSCKFVLLTHGHFDHVGGCGVLYESGAKICCGENEKDLIFSRENLSIFGGVKIPRFEISQTFKDREEVELCGIKFKIISPPGHTAGSVCYIAEDCIFSGDTLFQESVGRTDLPTGNSRELIASVKKLFSLKGDYKIYCGHEGDTTLQHERNFNPYIR